MIDVVLLDLSGVIYEGDHALPGAVDAVARLRAAGLPVRFLTNTTRSSRRVLLERIRSLGLDVDADELLTPAAAARAWLEGRGLSLHLLIHPDLEDDFRGLGGEKGAAVIVGDAGRAFTYDTMNAAFRALADGADFLALATNRTFEDEDGELSLDAGAFVAALEYATQRRAVVLGKPSAAFFSAATRSAGCLAAHAAMVGDDAEMDVAGALAAGLGHGILVRTGKYRHGAETVVDPPPTAVVDDMAAAADWILQHRTS